MRRPLDGVTLSNSEGKIKITLDQDQAERPPPPRSLFRAAPGAVGIILSLASSAVLAGPLKFTALHWTWNGISLSQDLFPLLLQQYQDRTKLEPWKT